MARAIGGRVTQAGPAPREEARILAAQNRLLKRGATLHTTTALTRPQQTDSVPAGAATRWEGMIRFDDSAVLDWYRASSSALLRDFQMHTDRFDQALRLFPDDPLLLMLAGSLHGTSHPRAGVHSGPPMCHQAAR
jgi:hypothetical protein